jgi:hypothetical protein
VAGAADKLAALTGGANLNEEQTAFLEKLSALIDELKPKQLSLDKLLGRVRATRKRESVVQLTIPHRSDSDLELGVAVEPHAIVVGYGSYDHIHFGYGEPDPPAADALPFIRALLEGRVEVEITYGWVWTNVATFEINASGQRVRIQSGSSPAMFSAGWKWPPRIKETRRLSFA